MRANSRAGSSWPIAILAWLGRNIDIVICFLALPFFVIAELPLLGWAATTVAWVGGRILQYFLERRAAAELDHKRFFGYMAGSLIGRSWLLALSVFAVGIIERQAGLAAAVLALIVFTAYLVTSMITQRGAAVGQTGSAGPSTGAVA